MTHCLQRLTHLVKFASRQTRFIACFCLMATCRISFSENTPVTAEYSKQIGQILARVNAQDFHPIRDGFTYDRQLNKPGVASLENQDWRVRTLAVRDLVRLGTSATPVLITTLEDENAHVRHVSAMVLGILQATNAVLSLEKVLREDSDAVVRSQAAIALGQIGQRTSLPAVQAAQMDDKSRDVQRQAELTAYAIEHEMRATPALAKSYAALDESTFGRVQAGETARDFQLIDTEGKAWRLSDFRVKKPVVLI
jgi:hypothetical protein